MIKRMSFKKSSLSAIAGWVTMLSVTPFAKAYAFCPPSICGSPSAPPPGAVNSTIGFSKISENVVLSVESLPGMVSGLSYLFATMLGTTAILKIKDHVENPRNTPLSVGAIRLVAGGALFALPIVFEAMHTTIGVSNSVVASAPLQAVAFNVTD